LPKLHIRCLGGDPRVPFKARKSLVGRNFHPAPVIPWPASKAPPLPPHADADFDRRSLFRPSVLEQKPSHLPFAVDFAMHPQQIAACITTNRLRQLLVLRILTTIAVAGIASGPVLIMMVLTGVDSVLTRIKCFLSSGFDGARCATHGSFA
jgi:hypothetical protein